MFRLTCTPLYRGGGQGGGGTGIRWAESGWRGRNRGWWGAESGVKGVGSGGGDRGGGESGKIGAGIDFFK